MGNELPAEDMTQSGPPEWCGDAARSFPPFLALCGGDGTLNANKAGEIWPGLESVPWAALSERESVSGAVFCRPRLDASGRMDRPKSLK
jgi:hypothetical protein